MADAAIRLQALDGTWETCGVDRLRGIVPEGLQCSSNEWGSDKASFTLKRDPGGQYPDLTAYTPVDIEIGGQLVWSGRISETPTRDTAADRSISVECEGWQYHLDDDAYQRCYVHTRLADWQDARTYTEADLGNYSTGWNVRSDGGAIFLEIPSGSTAPANTRCGVVLDTGDAEAVKRIIVTYKGGGHAALNFAAFQAANPTGATENTVLDGAPITTSSTTVGYTFTTARRYVQLVLYDASGANVNGDATTYVRITAVQVFRSTAYESGSGPVIKADTIVKDARDTATALLSTSNDRIETQTFSLPEFHMDSQRTPREVIQAVNAYEDCQAAVDVHKRLVFRDKPTTPLFETGPGVEFEDASANSGEEIYTRAIIEGTGADGQNLQVTRNQSLATLVSRRAFYRTKILQVSSAGTTASYNQIGDLYLAGHRTTPMRGKVKATGPSAIRKVLGGEPVHPAKLLIHTAEMVRLPRIDPDTGGFGRDCRIVNVSYNHDTQTADVDLDNRRSNFEALLERLSIVTGRIPG